MKRSNRLILLLGLILAVVAFVGIILVLNNNQPSGPATPTTAKVVVAATDIRLGEKVTADKVTTKDLALDAVPADSFKDVSLVIGRVVRKDTIKDEVLREATTFAAPGVINTDIGPLLDKGKRAMSVKVNQESGVGTLVKSGDRVDIVLGITGADNFPVLVRDPQTQTLTQLPGVNPTSIKLIIQNLRVLGTLLPETTDTTGDQPSEGGSGQQGTTLNNQEQIVILEVTGEQAEILRFAQISGSITLLLRATADFVDEAGQPVQPPEEQIRGIILKRLVDEFQVLPPQIVETTLPGATPAP